MKTLTMTLVALTAIALAAAPSASACQYHGPAAETVNYVLPCATNDAAEDTVTLAETVVDAVVDYVTGIPLP